LIKDKKDKNIGETFAHAHSFKKNRKKAIIKNRTMITVTHTKIHIEEKSGEREPPSKNRVRLIAMKI